MAAQIKVRRGLKENLPTLAVGEFGFCTDTNELFIGTAEGNEMVNGGLTVNDLTRGEEKNWSGTVPGGGHVDTGLAFTMNELFTATIKFNGEIVVNKGVPLNDWQYHMDVETNKYLLSHDIYTNTLQLYIFYIEDTGPYRDYAGGYLWDEEGFGPCDIDITTYGEHVYLLDFEAFTKKESYNRIEIFKKTHPFNLHTRELWLHGGTGSFNFDVGFRNLVMTQAALSKLSIRHNDIMIVTVGVANADYQWVEFPELNAYKLIHTASGGEIRFNYGGTQNIAKETGKNLGPFSVSIQLFLFALGDVKSQYNELLSNAGIITSIEYIRTTPANGTWHNQPSFDIQDNGLHQTDVFHETKHFLLIPDTTEIGPIVFNPVTVVCDDFSGGNQYHTTPFVFSSPLIISISSYDDGGSSTTSVAVRGAINEQIQTEVLDEWFAPAAIRLGDKTGVSGNILPFAVDIYEIKYKDIK